MCVCMPAWSHVFKGFVLQRCPGETTPENPTKNIVRNSDLVEENAMNIHKYTVQDSFWSQWDPNYLWYVELEAELRAIIMVENWPERVLFQWLANFPCHNSHLYKTQVLNRQWSNIRATLNHRQIIIWLITRRLRIYIPEQGSVTPQDISCLPRLRDQCLFLQNLQPIPSTTSLIYLEGMLYHL